KGTRAGADVEDAQPCCSFVFTKRGNSRLHDCLRFRPRNEDPVPELERQSPEFPLADNACDRLMGEPARRKCPDCNSLLMRDASFALECKFRVAEPKRVADQQAGIKLRTVNSVMQEYRGHSAPDDCNW